MTFARGIAFEYRASPGLIRVGAGVAALAAMAPWFTGLPLVLRFFLAVAIAMVGYARLRAFGRPALSALCWASDDVWTVTLAGGDERAAEPRHARIFGRAVFLDLRWDGGAEQVALLPDNLAADELRLLRGRLMSGKR
ncbi:hypothetical protein SAMN02800694_3327 [Luteibacter sp. UNCMF331Sha3.1]|uniref:hypothetical protein n=1 Tax=Luteibacter sp. UNCMF331Sha3.1 TaxID=1502760 RepID=UPI0008BB5CFE|nr:hypothetical protein [Luteibacter sp. UNCMF331Sha3.1]SEN36840.1 hypothetical protein SAMN02800694_3327 [Luteibacter sp. UNCMF331Sha3.1]